MAGGARAGRRPGIPEAFAALAALSFVAARFLPVLGLGIAGLSSHYCLSNAFRSGEATVVVPLDFLRIPLIALVGWWFYGERLDVHVFLGAGLIIAGVLWNLRVESRPLPRAGRPSVTTPRS